jgi:hypothetical protein
VTEKQRKIGLRNRKTDEERVKNEQTNKCKDRGREIESERTRERGI